MYQYTAHVIILVFTLFVFVSIPAHVNEWVNTITVSMKPMSTSLQSTHK